MENQPDVLRTPAKSRGWAPEETAVGRIPGLIRVALDEILGHPLVGAEGGAVPLTAVGAVGNNDGQVAVAAHREHLEGHLRMSQMAAADHVEEAVKGHRSARE
jgi:hypothetical protein